MEDIAIRSKDATNGAPGRTTSSKKLLVTKGIATRSKDAIGLEGPSPLFALKQVKFKDLESTKAQQTLHAYVYHCY